MSQWLKELTQVHPRDLELTARAGNIMSIAMTRVDIDTLATRSSTSTLTIAWVTKHMQKAG